MNLGGTIRLNRTGLILAVIIGVVILFIHFSRYKSSYEESEENLVNLKSLLVGAIEAAELGGKKVIAGTKGELKVRIKGKTQEGVNDPVTDADFASHCEMYGGLARAFPNLHIRSEEDVGSSCPPPPALALVATGPLESLPSVHVHPEDVTVWIDPLDATKEYTDSMYQFVTTMVCVAVKGVPIIGVIHRPFTQLTSWAWLAQSSSQDLQLTPPTGDHKQSPHVVVSMSHKGAVKDLASAALGPASTISEAAGAGYKVLEVAQARADLYLHITHIKKWDVCAGNAIINAMGGRMTTLKNETLDYSFDSQDVNKDGLLVATQNHDYYIGKIMASKINTI